MGFSLFERLNARRCFLPYQINLAIPTQCIVGDFSQFNEACFQFAMLGIHPGSSLLSPHCAWIC